MDYAITGAFVEACDCTVVCPCWVDEDPFEGACTGLIAWDLARGSFVGGVDVGGRQVVSISTHSGSRRGGNDAATFLYIDDDATPEQFDALVRAFSGTAGGPLGELATVSGTVLGAKPATVLISGSNRDWRVRISPSDAPDTTLVRADGVAKVFRDQPEPLRLRNTALTEDLGVVPETDVVAQAGGELYVNVGELPGGSLEVSGRSGMTGRFSYTWGAVPSPTGQPTG